ncbi:MAG: thioredoxin [Aquifex sp.]|nr:MAG: thioredoxin [Aquifex sp.]
MMAKFRHLFYIVIFTLLFACSSENKNETVKETSKSIIPKQKYALLIVESKSCIYCAQLKKDLKTEEILKKALEGMDLYTLLYESYTPVKTNIGGKLVELPEKDLARKLNATSFPNLIFYDKNGNIILQIPGYLPPKEFVCVINYVKNEKFKEIKLQDYMKKCV